MDLATVRLGMNSQIPQTQRSPALGDTLIAFSNYMKKSTNIRKSVALDIP